MMLAEVETYISLFSLILLEIVLGIDNIIFVSILAGKLPEEKRKSARRLGLLMALLGRLLLLMSIAWLTKLTKPLFIVPLLNAEISGKSLVLLLGGIFLIFKSTNEIHEKIEDAHKDQGNENINIGTSLLSVILQIIMIDMIFSLDSIITAVGLVSHIPIMVVAVIIACIIMIWLSSMIGDFIDQHPSVKILALSFLLMIGTMLVAEAFEVHIPKGYIYFSLAFAMLVEIINIKAKSRSANK